MKIIPKITIILTSVLTFNSIQAQTELISEYDKAVNLLKAEDFQKASIAFSNLLTKATETRLKKFCYIYRAFSYNGLEQYSKAIADLDKAIEIDSSDIATYVDRGKAKVYSNDFVGAKKDFLFLLSRDSSSGQAEGALYYLSRIAYKEGEFQQSINYCDRYIILNPTDAEIYFNSGAAKDMLLDPAGSIKDYDMAIKLKPNYMEAYANRGVAKINLLRRGGNILLTKEQTKDPCSDLMRAKQLGDKSVDDMIYVHCQR